MTMFSLGVIGLGWVLYYRSRAFEISFLDPSRKIVGVPGYPYPLSFSDTDHFQLTHASDCWRLYMHLKNGDKVPLVFGAPLSFTRKTAIHTARLLGCSLLSDDGSEVEYNRDEVDWQKPHRIPSGTYPLEYLFLSAVLAATVGLILDYNMSTIFHSDIAPKWMLLLAIAFPGGQLITNFQEYRGFRAATIVMLGLLSVVYLATIVSQVEPAMTFLGLIPATVLIMLFINAYVERRKLLPWAIVTAVVVLCGFSLSLVTSYNFHTFFRLDPVVVTSIDVSSTPDTTQSLTKPADIRGVVRAIKTGKIQRNMYQPVSQSVTFYLKRPVGRSYNIVVFREGSGRQQHAVCRLYCDFLGVNLPLGRLASQDMNNALNQIGTLHGVWPPEY